MEGAEGIHGRTVQYEQPDWGPLLRVVGQHLARRLMWMAEIELRDGTRVHAYKHIDTRRYLHLDTSGRAFAFRQDASYREFPTFAAVICAFSKPGAKG